jgi:hypothetical protein
VDPRPSGPATYCFRKLRCPESFRFIGPWGPTATRRTAISATGGLYFPALEETEAVSLRAFAAALVRQGIAVGRPFLDWGDAIGLLLSAVLAIDGSFDHRRISATHLTREAERWNTLAPGEAEQIVTATLADFAKALDHVTAPQGVPAAATAQLARNLERLQAGSEIGERPTRYRRRRHAQAH